MMVAALVLHRLYDMIYRWWYVAIDVHVVSYILITLQQKIWTAKPTALLPQS